MDPTEGVLGGEPVVALTGAAEEQPWPVGSLRDYRMPSFGSAGGAATVVEAPLRHQAVTESVRHEGVWLGSHSPARALGVGCRSESSTQRQGSSVEASEAKNPAILGRSRWRELSGRREEADGVGLCCDTGHRITGAHTGRIGR